MQNASSVRFKIECNIKRAERKCAKKGSSKRGAQIATAQRFFGAYFDAYFDPTFCF